MIVAESLVKNYGSLEAVKNVSFSVNQGEILGLLGPNGAGKTTIMRILSGYQFPDSGRISIAGISLNEEILEIKKLIGYLPEQVPLYGDLTPLEFLGFAARARMIKKQEQKEIIEKALAACGLETRKNQRIETLSRGYKQRLGLAQAILHDPPILILDEPATGLDPNQIIEIRSLIRELGRQKTVILSTHILQEAEALCSRLLILNEGQAAAQGTLDEINGLLAGKNSSPDESRTWELLVRTSDLGNLEERLGNLGTGIRDITVKIEADEMARIVFSIPAKEAEGEQIFDWAVSEGIKILNMNRKNLSLEDIFIRLTEDSSRDASINASKDSSGSAARRKRRK